MTIIMSGKNQVTIPKKIADALGLHKGALFDVRLHKNKIEMIPLEVSEKVFSDEEYKKMERIAKAEKGREKKVTAEVIESFRKWK